MAIVVERKPLNWKEKTYIPQILKGLKITLMNLFRSKVTLQYPEERPVMPDRYRGVPALVKDPNGRVKCVSCQLCEFVCPPKAIRITPGEIADTDEGRLHVEKEPKEFEINMLRCIYCGLCEEVCPEEAIFLQEEQYSVVGLARGDFINKKEKLLELGGVRPDSHYKWGKKKEAEEAAKGAHH